MKIQLQFFVVLLLGATFGYAGEARLLRQPHIHNDRLVFMYAGDIWAVSSRGGQARKLTSFEGYEVFPRFSPDGQWIAFSGEYTGTRQIYIMPSEGGEPRQVTFYPDVGSMPPRGGWDNVPIDWTPDGKKILIRSNRTPYGQRVSCYFLVDPFEGGLEQPLQLPEGGPATLSPDGRRLAYNIKSREYRTWKRYKAGRAQDIWIYDLQADSIERITTYEGTDNFPMWVGQSIYFISDRESVDSQEPRVLNIFAYDIDTRRIRQITDFTQFDCLWPSRGQGGIVFENGGYIYHLDPETGNTRKISILLNDDKPHMRPDYKNVTGFVESFDISPTGKRALFSARGELFTVPEKHGDIRNVTMTPGVREMNVTWSPDGRHIAFLSEDSGDYELIIKPYHGEGKPVQLTRDTDSWITGYLWSPDSRKVLVADKKNRLRLVDVSTRSVTDVDRGVYSPIRDYSWSPDSRWVAYVKEAGNHMTSIWLYSLESGERVQLTSEQGNESSPVFSDDGKTLSFVAQRQYNWQTRRFDSRLFIGTLQADQPSPFAPLNDDEAESGESSDKKSEKKAKDDKKAGIIRIDVKGFEQRVMAYPMGQGRYHSLNTVNQGLVYLKGNTLTLFDMEKREAVSVMEQVTSYRLTSDEKKFLYRSRNMYGIASLKPGQKKGAGQIKLDGMKMKIDPAVEWKQIYTDAWRIMRDWFYDPEMHRVDWKTMHEKYAPLVDHAAHRFDLDYILGELIGELNAGHTYVNTGDVERVERIPVGLMGCELEADGDFYRIKKIFQGENWDSGRRSPLTQSGIQVREGEYLIGIDGQHIHTRENPYRFLENKAGVQVTLLINSRPQKKGSRKVVISPIASEMGLRRFAWTERNRVIVDSLSQGRIGYIYVPNTSFAGFESFYRGWFSQSHKEALIIDDRYNGGGSLPHPMTFDLYHPVLHYWARRNLPLYSTPYFAHEGPKVMLINGRSSSGGDALPAYFRILNLGPLMGQTTWGGLIGYSWSPRFVDNGSMAVPSFAYVNKDGEWDVEYYGVNPDIPVFDDPTLIQAGREPMLEEAVRYLLKKLKENPGNKVSKPRGPVRN
jgi:tricorn protease